MTRIRPYVQLARDIARANVTRPGYPYRLILCLTYWCNYRCKTCNIWQMRPKDELTLEEVEMFFRKNDRFSWIDLTGGEPWLRKDFAEIAKIVTRQCKGLLLLHFPTNGYHTDRIVEGTREIAKNAPPKFIVTVSMDGDEETNDSVRGMDGGWRRQIETFRRLHEIRGVHVVLGMTVSHHNLGHYDKAFEAARKECPWLTHQDFHMNIVTTGHYLHNADLALGRAPKNALLAEVRAYRKKRGPVLGPVSFLEHEYLRLAEKYLRTGRTPMRCQALNSSCFVDSWGNVFPCTVWGKKIGSLRETGFDLAPIWESELARRTQGEVWRLECPQCWTPCEAYPTILGSSFASPVPEAAGGGSPARRPAVARAGGAVRTREIR
ncbi:MAG: radical SAM protein [Planctomycetes bacterium]|nr:radical SAM protein [Planctomycetota bacterium]